jgi:hypothetical protein
MAASLCQKLAMPDKSRTKLGDINSLLESTVERSKLLEQWKNPKKVPT